MIIYTGFVLILDILLTLIYDYPSISLCHNTLLPVFIGAAILLGLYHLFAYLGRKRMEKEIED